MSQSTPPYRGEQQSYYQSWRWSSLPSPPPQVCTLPIMAEHGMPCLPWLDPQLQMCRGSLITLGLLSMMDTANCVAFPHTLLQGDQSGIIWEYHFEEGFAGVLFPSQHNVRSYLLPLWYGLVWSGQVWLIKIEHSRNEWTKKYQPRWIHNQNLILNSHTSWGDGSLFLWSSTALLSLMRYLH